MAIPDIGNPDGYQNKGDSKSCPDLGARARIEQGSRDKWGRTIRMELDYTRQCITKSFTKSRAILSVCILMKPRDLAWGALRLRAYTKGNVPLGHRRMGIGHDVKRRGHRAHSNTYFTVRILYTNQMLSP